MIWEGLTDRQLCELFKDPQQNGGRDVDQIVEPCKRPWCCGAGTQRTAALLFQFLRLRFWRTSSSGQQKALLVQARRSHDKVGQIADI